MQMRSRSCQLFPSPSSPFPATAAATPPLLYPPLEEEGGEDPLVLFFFFNLAEEEPSSLERLGVVCYLKSEKERGKYRLISLRLRPFPPRYKLPFPLRPFNSGRKFPPFSNSPQLDKLEKAPFPAFLFPLESRGGGRDLPPLCYNTPTPFPPFTTFPSSSFCLVKASSSSSPSTPLFLSNIVNEH